jgi:glycosyltransferase involved in cell wall biosynthesis
VYDDCSTDGTTDVVKEFARKYTNIITDIQSRNLYSEDYSLRKSIVLAILKKHDCKYLAMADGDDYWTDPYKLQTQIDFLENHDEFNICSGGFVLNDHFTGTQKINLRSYGNLTGFEYDFCKMCALGDISRSFTMVCRAQVIPGFEITDKYPMFSFDTHMAYYALQKGKGYYFSRIFGVYNEHSGGVHSRLSRQERTKWAFDIYDKLYREERDEQIKNCFLRSLNAYVFGCLTNKEDREHFLKEIVEKYPELADDVIAF